MVTTREPVTVSLKDLEQGTIPLSALEEAFGPNSLGIIVVKDLPTKFVELRHKVLSFSSYLANLPKEELDALESPTSTYLTGWSLGREKLKNNRPDTLKGSYYINAAFHKDAALECSPTSRPEGLDTSTTSSNSSNFSNAKHYDTFPEYTTPNLWPTEALLPGFRPATTDLCNLIIDTATLVARACDRFAEENVPEYERGYLERMVRDSMTTKARLLHYFPAPAPKDKATSIPATAAKDTSVVDDHDDDDWCATHLDHGCLTGLTSAMYIDEALCFPSSPTATPHATPTSTDEGGANVPLPLPELQASPDPAAGLYIQSRGGEVVQVKIPRDCLAFQTGAALESVTRGRLRAVPHFVRGVRNTGASTSSSNGQSRVARNTLAIFTQPNLWDVVDTGKGVDFATFSRGVIEKNY